MTKQYSAWKEGAVYYAPLLILGAALGAGTWPHPAAWLGIVLVLAGLATVGFFRDPHRTHTATDRELLSPADGKVVGIDDVEDSPYYDGPARRVAIFLSVLNVHVNRAPFQGEVTRIDYRPGEFLNALNPESGERNESNSIWLQTSYGPITVRQISGLIARRIVCKAQEGDQLDRAQKFGMIKFGSRTELFLPPGSEVCVRINENVRAGTSVMARFK